MHRNLLKTSVRRWLVASVLLAGLATLVAGVAPSADAQDNPQPPHWFWGQDLESYVGDVVVAINQDGDEVGATTVGSEGDWSIQVSPDDARTVSFRLISSSVTRETGALDVVFGGFDPAGISISDFSRTVQAEEAEEIVDLVELEDVGPTLPVRIIARLHPTRDLRTLEFNIRVNGVDIDPPPAARYLTPGLVTDRWYQSSVIDAGDGYRVRVIACKQSDDDVIFGLRVEGHSDIIPQARRLANTITHNRWLRSSEIDIPLPRQADDVIRLGRGDIDCTAAPLAP